MINPLLKFNNIFRTQVDKLLGYSFSIRTIKIIKNYDEEEYICYGNNTHL